MSKYVVTYHHGQNVMVNQKLKGKHREHCMCYECDKFDPDNREKNCLIANAVYDNCVKFHLVTPVWECPSFVPA